MFNRCSEEDLWSSRNIYQPPASLKINFSMFWSRNFCSIIRRYGCLESFTVSQHSRTLCNLETSKLAAKDCYGVRISITWILLTSKAVSFNASISSTAKHSVSFLHHNAFTARSSKIDVLLCVQTILYSSLTKAMFE